MVEIACAPYPAFEASRLEEGEARSYTIERSAFQANSGSRRPIVFSDRSRCVRRAGELERLDRAGPLDQLHRGDPARRCLPVRQRRNRVFPWMGLELPVSSSEIRARVGNRRAHAGTAGPGARLYRRARPLQIARNCKR